VHVEGAQAGTPVTVDLPAAKLHVEGVTDAEGRVAISLPAVGLTLWSPETPKLYHVVLKAGGDTLTDEMGFRTIETSGTKILLNGNPIVLHRRLHPRRGPVPHRTRGQRPGRSHAAGLG